MNKSATQKIKELLENGESISPVEAIAIYGIIRLGGIIHVLRKRGLNIITEMRHDSEGHSYARYMLKESAPKAWKKGDKAIVTRSGPGGVVGDPKHYFPVGEEVTVDCLLGSGWVTCVDASGMYQTLSPTQLQ